MADFRDQNWLQDLILRVFLSLGRFHPSGKRASRIAGRKSVHVG